MASSLLLLVGLPLLYLGGESLVRGAAGLALRLGLTPLAVGLTVVAFGTSCPELSVALSAAFQGRGDVAMGNVVGSNIANVGLILAISGLFRPLKVHLQLIRFDLPLLAVVILVLVLTTLDRSLGRIEGATLVAGLVTYVTIVLRLARREGAAVKEQFTDVIADDHPPKAENVALLLAKVAGGFLLLALGGQAFVRGAVSLAEALQVPQAVIALTVVAMGTVLPELTASLVAVARGHTDIAVGNVIGSNLFNVLSILGITSLVKPIEFPGIGAADLFVMLAFNLALLPLLWTGWRLNRYEAAGLLIAYVSYVGFVATW